MMPMKVPTGTPSDTVKISFNCWSSEVLPPPLSSELHKEDEDEDELESERRSADETVVSWWANSAKHRRSEARKRWGVDENGEGVLVVAE